MRINKFIALATGHSRRMADSLIQDGHVRVNGDFAAAAHQVTASDIVTLDGSVVQAPGQLQTVLLYKPKGYIVSRDGQGGRTIYDLMPPELHHLKPVGRLDKDSSGLLLLTNNGTLAQELTHPKYQKTKRYEVTLNKPLQPLHRQMIGDIGIQLEDGRSQLSLERMTDGDETRWVVSMQEGRNRQIRRTFAALGYDVTRLHRTHFGSYSLPPELSPGEYHSLEQ